MVALCIGDEAHLNLLVKEFLEHYQTERPHQAKENEVLKMPKRQRPTRQRQKPNPGIPGFREIKCRKRPGGLLKHYYKKAA